MKPHMTVVIHARPDVEEVSSGRERQMRPPGSVVLYVLGFGINTNDSKHSRY